jgi:hypothetical protein
VGLSRRKFWLRNKIHSLSFQSRAPTRKPRRSCWTRWPEAFATRTASSPTPSEHRSASLFYRRVLFLQKLPTTTLAGLDPNVPLPLDYSARAKSLFLFFRPIPLIQNNNLEQLLILSHKIQSKYTKSLLCFSYQINYIRAGFKLTIACSWGRCDATEPDYVTEYLKGRAHNIWLQLEACMRP